MSFPRLPSQLQEVFHEGAAQFPRGITPHLRHTHAKSATMKDRKTNEKIIVVYNVIRLETAGWVMM